MIMSCFQEENVVAPKDACLKEQNGEYVIVPEEEGNTLNRNKSGKGSKGCNRKRKDRN